MGTAKHTPGPWMYLDIGEIVYDDGDVNPVVATINLDNTSNEQAEADGNLIAAAPELLAALAKAEGYLAFEKSKQGREIYRLARAAIAKATGAAS